MQNPRIHSVSHFLLQPLPHPFPPPTSHLALPDVTATSLAVTVRSLPPIASPPMHVTIPTAHKPPLNPHLSFASTTSVLLGTPPGELFHIDFSTTYPEPYPVADITDPDPNRSGILALASSPDASLHLIVSPVKVILLDPAFDLVAQLDHSLATHAVVSWRADSESSVVVMCHQDAPISGVVVNRNAQVVKALDLPPKTIGNPLVAWEPRVGGFILLVVNGQALFFERNGLRHLRSDFELGGDDIHALAWSFDSRWLAVAGQWGQNHEVRLFGRRNYKWYCGKRIHVGAKVASIVWGEDNLAQISIYLVDGNVITMDIIRCADVLSLGRGHVAFVIDGDKLLLTDFAKALLPPPMFHLSWSFGSGVDAVCNSKGGEEVGVLLEDGSFEIRNLGDNESNGLPPEESENGQVADGQRWALAAEDDDGPLLSMRSPVLLKDGLLVLVDHAAAWTMEAEHEELLRIFQLPNDAEEGVCIAGRAIDGCVRAIAPSTMENAIILATSKGHVMLLAVDVQSGEIIEVVTVAGAVSEDVVLISDHEVENGGTLVLAMDREGVLKVVELGSGSTLTISAECTSYYVHEGFLSFTTSSHLLYCMYMGTAKSKSYSGDRNHVPCILDALNRKGNVAEIVPQGLKLVEGKGATRPIDRESLIVTALPNDVSIVLQAPRGNLETICARPMVFEAVDKLAKSADYGKAFRLCRKQRVNMNHILDADYDLFIGNIAKFAAEVDNDSHLSIFMTLLTGNETKINAVCDEIVRVLRDMEGRKQYINAILTGLTRRQPPNMNGALEEIDFALNLSSEEGAAALDHLFVLVKNETKVYEEALGTYNLELALFVANNSQLDPADYSLELNKLSEMDEKMKKFSIDMRLERYEKALRHLHSIGDDKKDACVIMCRNHGLYQLGLELFRDDNLVKLRLLHGYGKYLVSKGEHEEAASVFIKVKDMVQVCDSYRKGGQWRLCATAICRSEISWSRKRTQLESLADELYESGKYAESAEIRMNHLGDVEGAVEALATAGEWEKMFEMVAGYCGQCKRGLGSKEKLLTSTLWNEVDGFVLDGAAGISATIEENKGKLVTCRKRLEVVRETKREMNERLAAKEAAEEEDSDGFTATTGSSMASNLSDMTFRTRSSATSLYSSASSQVGPLSEGKLRKQEERRQRKAAKKKVKEGSPREEEYLVRYLQTIVPGAFFRDRVGGIVRALLFVGKFDMVKALVLQMREFVEEARLVPVDVLGEETLVGFDDLGWAKGTECLDLL